MIKIGVLTTHPIQYQVPWFRLLAADPDVDLTVFFCFIPDEQQQGDGFGVAFKWDVPLLDGYRHEVLRNVAAKPGVSHFGGCDTPDIHHIVRDGGYDAFIVNGWVVKSCLQLLWACRKYRVPCIVRGESNDIRPRALWKRLIHRLLLSQYSALLYIGDGNKRFYKGNGVPERKLFSAPYGIENERFANASQALRCQRDVIREGWGILPGAVTYVFCAKFIDKKRPMDVLRALACLKEHDVHIQRRIHLLMVGSGELMESCRRYAQANDLPVTFAGFLNQSEMVKAYVASDCLVLPSDSGETWGLVVNEGMACGLPAIVSDQVGCHDDLVIPGMTGDVYPMGDIATLAGHMNNRAVDQAQLRAMGRAAQERVAHFTPGRVVAGVHEAMAYLRLGA